MSGTVETILLYTIGAGLLSIVYGFLTGKNILNSSADIKNFIKDPTISVEIQNEFTNIIAEQIGFLKNLKNL